MTSDTQFLLETVFYEVIGTLVALVIIILHILYIVAHVKLPSLNMVIFYTSERSFNSVLTRPGLVRQLFSSIRKLVSFVVLLTFFSIFLLVHLIDFSIAYNKPLSSVGSIEFRKRSHQNFQLRLSSQSQNIRTIGVRLIFRSVWFD